MNALDHPITFPYGATTAPYSPANPHKGDDRPTPHRTPLIVAGQLIGYTGSTGMAYGPHLHTQEWFGQSTAETRKPRNTGKPGTVQNTGTASQWGKFITIFNDDGWKTTYCHLDEVLVKAGQKIGGSVLTEDAVRFHYLAVTGSQPSAEAIKFWVGRSDITEFAKALYKLSDEYVVAYKKRIKELEATQDVTPYTGDQLFVKKKG